MRPLTPQQTLVDQVVNAIVTDIVEGELPAQSRLIQDNLAQAYGVSRHPVQQALLLLRSCGLVREAPGRGLIVAPLDVESVRNLYEVRAVLEGLSARMAAQNGAARAREEGPALLERGRTAVSERSLLSEIDADIAFHAFINDISSNPLIGETTAPHWPTLRRVMGEVLRDDARMPHSIWDEHEAILDAIGRSDGESAERLSRAHILRAAGVFVQRLQALRDRQDAADAAQQVRRSRHIQR